MTSIKTLKTLEALEEDPEKPPVQDQEQIITSIQVSKALDELEEDPAKPLKRQDQKDPTSITIGLITAAHGVRGEVKVQAFTQCPQDVVSYGPLAIEDESFNRHRYPIEYWRVSKTNVVIKLQGVDDRNAAENLINREVILERSSLSELPQEEYYHVDLIGLTVVDEHQLCLGTISAVNNFGAGDILEITSLDGAELSIPFIKQFVLRIDLEARYVVIAMPASYLNEARS